VSHRLYHTEGIVLRARPFGEANRRVTLLTPDLGRVTAHARGVRKLQAKLAPALQPYTCARVTLVRGQGSWRLTGAREQCNAYYAVRPDRQRTALVARLASLAERLVQGQQPEEACYQALREAYHCLATEALTGDDVANLECVAVLRMLAALGYVSEEHIPASLKGGVSISRAALREAAPHRHRAIHTINAALTASHL
jgi:DNA repair protein RecO